MRYTLLGRKPGRIRPSLDGLQEALFASGQPQRSFRSILIVGTNGKGSTAAMLERIAGESGLKTGLYTSPHLVDPSERIRCNGNDIDPETLAEMVRRFDAFPDLTYFEVLTAAAFVYFAESCVDLAVLEAGMGGQWDATRLAASNIAGLTNVGSDHSRWLGVSRTDIAADKGAALAAAQTAVLGPGVDSAIIEHLGAPSARPAQTMVSLATTDSPSRVRLGWADQPPITITCPLSGRHQLDNLHLALALAVAAAEHRWIDGLDPAVVQHALGDVRWPGRCSHATIHGRVVLLDGAHNAEAAAVLADHLRGLPETHHLLFSCLDDKPVEKMAAILRPVVGKVVIFELADERAMPLTRLHTAFPDAAVCDGALRRALDLLEDPVVAAGSLRLVGELLQGGE